MGRLINADVLREEVYSWGMNDYEPSDFTDAIDDAPTVEAIPKADYEARLKADMVAMLRFLWNDIENLDAPICDYASSDCISKWQVHEIIQQKINELKGDQEGKE